MANPEGYAWYEDPEMQASTPERVEELWDAPWNIGVLVGEQFGTFIIDIDMKAEKNAGWKTWQRLLEALGKHGAALSETMSERTSGHDDDSRGWHMFYKVTDPAAWEVLRKLPNSLGYVDFLVEKRQAVVAPSLHASGIAYEREKRSLPPQTLTLEQCEALLSAVRRIRSELHPEGPSDSAMPMGRGEWMAQLKYLLAMNRPMRTYGPGEHHDSLKGLFGAAVAMGDMITPDVAREYQREMERDSDWLPPWFVKLCMHIDTEVSRPDPWFQTDRPNFVGVVKYAVRNEMKKALGAETWAQSRQHPSAQADTKEK